MSDSLWTHGLYIPWNSSGQNTGVGSLSLLQGIFPTQESNQGLLHCRQILYQLSYQGSQGTRHQNQVSASSVLLGKGALLGWYSPGADDVLNECRIGSVQVVLCTTRTTVCHGPGQDVGSGLG